MTPTPGVTTPPTDEQLKRLVALARAFIVSEVGEDMGSGMTDQADRFADAVQPFIAQALADQAAAIHARYEKGLNDLAHELSSYRFWHPTADDAADMVQDLGRRMRKEAER